MFKKQETSLLMSSSDNIDGTQTLLTQLSAVKLKSIEKRGKIQTTKGTLVSSPAWGPRKSCVGSMKHVLAHMTYFYLKPSPGSPRCLAYSL